MKELSIEGKATRYDQAIKVAKSKIKNDKDHVLYEDDVIEIFPELIESEDERIRKNCIHFLELQTEHHAAIFEIEECIAWLEKQGEQKPAWSEEDEIMFRKAIITIDNVRMDTDSQEYYQGICDWLKSLKDRCLSHPQS